MIATNNSKNKKSKEVKEGVVFMQVGLFPKWLK